MCPRKCQWCSAPFETKHPTKMFCNSKCKIDFNNHMTVFGRRLAPVAMAWRSQRGRAGVGADALKEMCAMLDKAYTEYLEDVETGRKAQPISKHFEHCRKSGVGVTFARDR